MHLCDIALYFSCSVLIWCLYQSKSTASHSKCGSETFPSNFGKSLRRTDVHFSLSIQYNSPEESSGLGGLFFVVRFFIIALSFSVVIGMFTFFSSLCSLGKLYVYRNFLISSRLSSCWHAIADSSLLIFHISEVSVGSFYAFYFFIKCFM